MIRGLFIAVFRVYLLFAATLISAAENDSPSNSVVFEQTYIIHNTLHNTFNQLSDIHLYQYLMPHFSQIKVQSTYQLNSLAQLDEFVAISAKAYGPISIEQYSLGRLLADKQKQMIQLQWRKANGDSTQLSFFLSTIEGATRIQVKTLLTSEHGDIAALLEKEQASPSVRFDVLTSLLEEGFLIDVHACQSQLNRYCF